MDGSMAQLVDFFLAWSIVCSFPLTSSPHLSVVLMLICMQLGVWVTTSSETLYSPLLWQSIPVASNPLKYRLLRKVSLYPIVLHIIYPCIALHCIPLHCIARRCKVAFCWLQPKLWKWGEALSPSVSLRGFVPLYFSKYFLPLSTPLSLL